MHPIINRSKSQGIWWFVTDSFLHVYWSKLVLRCQKEHSSGTDSSICYSKWRKAAMLVPVKQKKKDVFIMRLLFHPLLAPMAVASNPPRAFFFFIFFYNAVTVLTAINTVFIAPCSTSRLQRWPVKGQSSLLKGREGKQMGGSCSSGL